MAKMEIINGERVLVDRKPIPKQRKKLQTLGEHVLEHFQIEDNLKEYENKMQNILPKEWKLDIIKNIINSITSINTEQIFSNIAEGTFNIRFINKLDSEKFCEKVLQNIFKFTNQYLRDKDLDPKTYARSFIVFTDVTDYDLIIKI